MLANLRTLIALYQPYLRLQRYKTIFKSTTLMSIKRFLIVHFNFLGVCEASYTPIAEQLQQTKTSESQDCFIAISALALTSYIIPHSSAIACQRLIGNPTSPVSALINGVCCQSGNLWSSLSGTVQQRPMRCPSLSIMVTSGRSVVAVFT